MPNLSKMSQVVSLNTPDGIDKLNKLQENLLNFDDEAKHDIKELTKFDADSILNDLIVGYQTYITSLPEKEQKHASKPVGYSKELPDGYSISLYGKNLLMYEYGTGDQGANNPYPSSKSLAKHGWKYNSGPKVIKAGQADELLSYQDLPKWYIGFLHKHPGIDRHNWWMSPYGISNGIPAGRILYDTWNFYRGELLSDSTSKVKLTKRNLKYIVKNKITKDL